MLKTKLFLILLLTRALATENVVKNVCENAIKNTNEHDAKKVLLLHAQKHERQDNQGLQAQENKNEEVQHLNEENQAEILDNCPICYGALDDEANIVTGICNSYHRHSFHFECIIDWLKHQRNNSRDESCPVCRKIIHEVQVRISVNEFLNLGNQQQIINQQGSRLKVAYAFISFLLAAYVLTYSDQILLAVDQMFSMVSQILPSHVIEALRFANSNRWLTGLVALVEPLTIKELVRNPNVKNLLFFLSNTIFLSIIIAVWYNVWTGPIPTSEIGDFDAMFAYYKAPTSDDRRSLFVQFLKLLF